MQRSSRSLERGDGDNPPLRVELPERTSNYLSHRRSPVSSSHSPISPGQESQRDLGDRDCKSPVSPAHNRISSSGIESIKTLINKDYDATNSPVQNHERTASPLHEGLQSINDHAGKDSNNPHVDPTEKEFYNRFPTAPEVQERRDPKPKKRKRLLLGAFVIIACIAVGLGVGLGVGLTRNKGSKANNRASSDTDSAHPVFSRTGAFNGSGIALASQSFASGGYGSIVMYFQHHTGQLRQAQLGSDGQWRGGDATEIVATDAKNATPIAAVAYARDNKALWHIFYININNTITEIINSNTTNVWSAGPLNDLQLQAMDDPDVGLQACWYGGFYSDAAYNHSPVPGQTNVTSGQSDQTVGIHLWYAKDPTTFQSLGWSYGDDTWSQQQTFDNYNGHAGVGCYSWGPGSNTYVFFVDMNNEINILWKDLNTSTAATNSHPINQWTKANVTIPVYENSSVGYTNYLYVQNPDLSIGGFNVTWAAENTSIANGQNFVINGKKGLPGTHLSVTALPDPSGGNSLLVFYQTNGTDITEFVRDLDAGQWTTSQVPIPN